ncbi:MAG: response regulator [Clostridiales bacterium]|jgi:putative two-component system response regulator|nr:response regulator [Clostridiales bacterium]
MTGRKVIMAVDDNPANIQIVVSVLRTQYAVVPFTSAKEALTFFDKGQTCDLILLDIEMPGMNGFEMMRELSKRDATKQIPVIFLTGKVSSQSELDGLALGAVDYLYKPIVPELVQRRIKTHMQLAEYSKNLEGVVAEKTATIQKLTDVTITTIVSIIGSRDMETQHHVTRTSAYIVTLAEELRKLPQFEKELSDESIAGLRRAAPLHDVGKVGIADAILSKPGKLTDEEFETMRRHTTIGGEAFKHAAAQMGEPSFLDYATELAYYHHEKWDGSGYPGHLSGKDIPLSARIMAVADVYDALISKRAYKSGMTHGEVVTRIVAGRGTHFDPVVVDAFRRVEDKFKAIAERYAD